MILRRVIAHFRKQEWTAIAIDFLIVVVGVFVGLQVNNWNEALGQKAAEADYLTALENDAEFSIESLQGTIERMKQAQEARKALYQYNIEPDAKRPAAEINGLLQGALFNVQRLNIRQVAFDALTSSGQLSLIGDPALASELQALETAIEEARRWETESNDFTYQYSDRYLIEEADTEHLMIAFLVGDGEGVKWIKGREGQSLTPEQLKSVRFKNLLLYQAEISRGRIAKTESCLRQYEKVLALINARQAEIGGGR